MTRMKNMPGDLVKEKKRALSGDNTTDTHPERKSLEDHVVSCYVISSLCFLNLYQVCFAAVY